MTRHDEPAEGDVAGVAVEVERACEVMHDAYERAAVGAGWETQEASRKPWADVPEANKQTMRAAVGALLDHLGTGRAAVLDEVECALVAHGHTGGARFVVRNLRATERAQ